MKKLHKEEKCLEYCDLVLIHEAKIKEQNVLLNEIIRDCAKINKSMNDINGKLNVLNDNVKKLVSYIMPNKKLLYKPLY